MHCAANCIDRRGEAVGIIRVIAAALGHPGKICLFPLPNSPAPLKIFTQVRCPPLQQRSRMFTGDVDCQTPDAAPSVYRRATADRILRRCRVRAAKCSFPRAAILGHCPCQQAPSRLQLQLHLHLLPPVNNTPSSSADSINNRGSSTSLHRPRRDILRHPGHQDQGSSKVLFLYRRCR